MSEKFGIINSVGYRGVAQLVAHTSGGRDAAGSSPVTPTITSVLIGFKYFYENTRFFVPYMFHTATQALVSK